MAQSCIEDGKGVGPLRVWPGGLAMSRTIGDASGGDVVSATPDVRQVGKLSVDLRCSNNEICIRYNLPPPPLFMHKQTQRRLECPFHGGKQHVSRCCTVASSRCYLCHDVPLLILFAHCNVAHASSCCVGDSPICWRTSHHCF